MGVKAVAIWTETTWHRPIREHNIATDTLRLRLHCQRTGISIESWNVTVPIGVESVVVVASLHEFSGVKARCCLLARLEVVVVIVLVQVVDLNALLQGDVDVGGLLSRSLLLLWLLLVLVVVVVLAGADVVALCVVHVVTES